MDFIREAKVGNLEIREDDPLKQKGSRYAFPREWYTCNLKTDRGSVTLLMTDVAAGVTGFEPGVVCDRTAARNHCCHLRICTLHLKLEKFWNWK